MITFLRGTVVEKQPTRVVMDVGGVGYEAFIPLSSYDRIPATNEVCQLLIHDHVREDTHILFGFMTEQERRMFILLLGITGIGPKLALSSLSGLSVRELKAAIVQSDVKRLSSISGLGRKTAERITVELRDKIGLDEALEAIAGPSLTPDQDTRLRDAIMALISLGYKQSVARKMVAAAMPEGHSEGLGVEEIIKKALT